MIALLTRLRHDARGTAITELAIVAPILGTMLVGMTDLARGYSTKLQLEQAGQRSIEKIMQTSFDTTATAAIKTEAANTADVPESAVTVTYWRECRNGSGPWVRQTGASMDDAYNGVCASGENYARYISVSISKVYTPMFAMKFLGANANGTYTILGKSGVRVQ